MYGKIILISCSLLILISCGYKEGAIQQEELSYIQFTGAWDGTTVQIDNSEPFKLSSTAAGGNPILKYGLSPGKHQIMVWREERLLVNRVLTLGNQQSMEVRIP